MLALRHARRHTAKFEEPLWSKRNGNDWHRELSHFPKLADAPQ